MLSFLPVLLLGASAAFAAPPGPPPLPGGGPHPSTPPGPPGPPGPAHNGPPVHATLPEACEFAFGTAPNSFKSDFTRIVTFGDSSTDTGRAFQLTGGLSPPAFYYDHSYSNGPVYPRLLSERLGVDLLGCAIGGATSNNTRAPGTLLNMTVPSAIDQVNSYLAALGGKKPEQKKTLEGRLHVILVGQNNINANPRATGADAVEDIRYAVGKLLDAGAAHILLFNSVDLGKNTPYALGAPQLVPLLSGWANSFRDALFHYFGPYGADNENPKVAVVDTFALANIINGAYEQFQFNPATRGVPCVRAGVNGAAGTVCTPEVAAQSMFWDQLHPSARTHSLFAASALAAMKAKGWVTSA